jgi:hypothetical protein
MNLPKALLFAVCFLLFVSHRVSAQAAAPCQPPDIAAAVYDIVPDASLQTGDFRPLMKTETAFIAKLREQPDLDATDLTTPILPADIQPEPPRITGKMDPPSSQLNEPYFFSGQITKIGAGFLLTVQLKKSPDGTLLNETKTPFPDAAGAEAAGNTAAAAMIAFFATQAQTARDNRESSDHAIDPHIDLIIDKLQLKPNETSPVKIVLTDCDGVRLKHRTIEAFLQLARGGVPVQENTLTRITDDKGERNGEIGSHTPGVITYLAKFKYKDQMGVQRERTDSKTVVVSGGEAHMWQMRADIQFESSTLYYSTDTQSGRWSGRRHLIRKRASIVFVFKADDTDPSGDVSVNEPASFNGFGEVYLRDKIVDHQDTASLRIASGLLDLGPAAVETLQPNFSISPTNNEFQASLNNVAFVGTEEMFAASLHPRNYVHKTGIEFHEGMGGSGATPITPQMKKSGIYTISKFERRLIDDPENGTLSRGGTKGYELTKFDIEVRRVAPAGTGLIRR